MVLNFRLERDSQSKKSIKLMSPEFSMALCTDQKDKRLWVRDYCITGKQNVAWRKSKSSGKNPSLFVAQPVKWMNLKDSQLSLRINNGFCIFRRFKFKISLWNRKPKQGYIRNVKLKRTVSRYCACPKLWFSDRTSRNQKIRGEYENLEKSVCIALGRV